MKKDPIKLMIESLHTVLFVGFKRY